MNDEATGTCALPHQALIQDTPHAHVGDMQRENIHSLNLEGCNIFYAVVALYEHESASHRFGTWPDKVQVLIDQEIARFIARNPTAKIEGFTQGVNKRSCTMAIHWRPQS